jgi:6-phosphogluconolactonase (cycloisomerase 2 family)
VKGEVVSAPDGRFVMVSNRYDRDCPTQLIDTFHQSKST